MAEDVFGTESPAVRIGADPITGAEDVAQALSRLHALRSGGVGGLEIGVAAATAAFSRRDTHLIGYRAAAAALQRRGFEPMIRPVGGHLAVYDEGSLIIHLWGRHEDPRRDLQRRFAVFSAALAAGLRELGVDARVGAVPGEYCDGEYSVNEAGRSKLIGVGQRLIGVGFLISAVVMVRRGEQVSPALEDAYRLLGLDLAPATIGCVDDALPGVALVDVRGSLLASLRRVLP